jgi:putative peptidoglycan lipid II flippase
MSQMLKSSGSLAAATMTSRILGMVREMVYAWFMGVSVVAGCFQLAFQIPNLFRRLLGEGALTASFIPMFKEKERTGTEAEMWRAANAVISGLVVVASIITLLAILGISLFLASGYLARQMLPPFSAKNIKNVQAFAADLEKPKTQALPLAQFIHAHLSEASLQAMLGRNDTSAPLKEREERLRVNLMNDLNDLIESGPLYEPTRFAGVAISPVTHSLLEGHLQGAQLVWVNRLLLEDAYPEELSDNYRETELMLRLLRVMFPYMLLICLTAVFMGILNARGHFFIPASGAVVMNAVMIASVFFLAPHMGATLRERIFALAFGVLVAGTAQAAFQLPWLRGEGFRYRWVSPWSDPTVKRVVRQMIPGTIGIAAFQINILTTQGIAFCINPIIVPSFNYAVRLMELPQGVFGVSLATYLLPTLSGLAAEKRYDRFRSTLNQAIDHLVFINLLAGILLFFLAEPIIRLLFERGEFGLGDTPKVANALIYLAPGLVAFSLTNILARAFYALGDTKTPMKISIFCLGINLMFALVLVWRMKQGGLALANTMSALFNVSLLFYALRRKLGRLEFGALRQMLWPVFVAGIVAALTAWFTLAKWESALGHRGLLMRLGAVFVPMTAASVVYFVAALLFKVPPAMEMGALVLKQLPFGRKTDAG